MDDNSFEKDPSSVESKGERVISEGDDFEEKFANGVPPFAGEQFDGEATKTGDDNELNIEDNNDTEFNKKVALAASITLYGGLDAAVRDLNEKNGKSNIEDVIRIFEQFDPSGSDDPLRDLYIHLGIDTEKEFNDVREESQASKSKAVMEKFRKEYNLPATQRKSREGFIKAVRDTKELITEVKTANPRYQELRDAARSANKGVFEYIAENYDGYNGLTEIFGFLAKQKERKEQVQPTEETEPTSQEEQVQPDQEGDTTLQPTQSEKESANQESITDQEESTLDQESPTPNQKSKIIEFTRLNPEILDKEQGKKAA